MPRKKIAVWGAEAEAADRRVAENLAGLAGQAAEARRAAGGSAAAWFAEGCNAEAVRSAHARGMTWPAISYAIEGRLGLRLSPQTVRAYAFRHAASGRIAPRSKTEKCAHAHRSPGIKAAAESGKREAVRPEDSERPTKAVKAPTAPQAPVRIAAESAEPKNQGAAKAEAPAARPDVVVIGGKTLIRPPPPKAPDIEDMSEW